MVPLDSAMDAPRHDAAAPVELQVVHVQMEHKVFVVPADLKVVVPKTFPRTDPFPWLPQILAEESCW